MKNNSQKGFTLVELILSLAIIAIVSVAFFSLFTMGIKGIAISGHKTKSEFKAQEAVESFINGTPQPLGVDPGITAQSSNPSSLTVNFSGGTTITPPNIKEVSVTYTFKGKEVTINTILP